MMRPQPRRFIPGSAALMAWKLEEKLIAMIASHFASGNSSIGATCWMPALFTRMSHAAERRLGRPHHRRAPLRRFERSASE